MKSGHDRRRHRHRIAVVDDMVFDRGPPSRCPRSRKTAPRAAFARRSSFRKRTRPTDGSSQLGAARHRGPPASPGSCLYAGEQTVVGGRQVGGLGLGERAQRRADRPPGRIACQMGDHRLDRRRGRETQDGIDQPYQARVGRGASHDRVEQIGPKVGDTADRAGGTEPDGGFEQPFVANEDGEVRKALQQAFGVGPVAGGNP